MWHFVTLDQDQKLERRRLLTTYGTIAQIIPLFLIFYLWLYFLACWVHDKLRQNSALESPGSPYQKEARRAKSSSLFSRVRSIWRREAWKCSAKIEIAGFQATKGEVVLAGAYMGLLLMLCFVQTEGGKSWHLLVCFNSGTRFNLSTFV